MVESTKLVDASRALRAIDAYAEVFNEPHSPLYRDADTREETAHSIVRDMGREYAELFLEKTRTTFSNTAPKP